MTPTKESLEKAEEIMEGIYKDFLLVLSLSQNGVTRKLDTNAHFTALALTLDAAKQEGIDKGLETAGIKLSELLKEQEHIRQEGRVEGAEEERQRWVQLLEAHRHHCSPAGNKHLTEVKNNIIGKRLKSNQSKGE